MTAPVAARIQRGDALTYRMTVIVILAALLLAAIAAGVEIDRHVTVIEQWVAGLGPWALPMFVVLFVVAVSILVPESALCLAAGVLFGFAWAVIAVGTATLLAAMLQYGLARIILRARIQTLIGTHPKLAAIQRAVLTNEVNLQLLLRLAPLNPASISYLLGATGVRFSTFLLGLLPLPLHFIAEVYVGRAGKHLALRAGGHREAAPLEDLVIAGGLVAAIVVTVFLSRVASRALDEAIDAAPMTGSGAT